MFGLFADPREKLIKKTAKKAMPIIRENPKWKMFKYMVTQLGAVSLGDLMEAENRLSLAFAEISLMSFERTGSAPSGASTMQTIYTCIDGGIKFFAENDPMVAMIRAKINNPDLGE